MEQRKCIKKTRGRSELMKLRNNRLLHSSEAKKKVDKDKIFYLIRWKNAIKKLTHVILNSKEIV